jgi:hypothetical protein
VETVGGGCFCGVVGVCLVAGIDVLWLDECIFLCFLCFLSHKMRVLCFVWLVVGCFCLVLFGCLAGFLFDESRF